jgi:hypothetical protein
VSTPLELVRLLHQALAIVNAGPWTDAEDVELKRIGGQVRAILKQLHLPRLYEPDRHAPVPIPGLDLVRDFHNEDGRWHPRDAEDWHLAVGELIASAESEREIGKSDRANAESTGEDEIFVSATEAAQAVSMTRKQLAKYLSRSCEIRTRKPSKQRLQVHLPDLLRQTARDRKAADRGNDMNERAGETLVNEAKKKAKAKKPSGNTQYYWESPERHDDD